MTTNPYPKTITDEATGQEFANDKYLAYNEGYLAGIEDSINNAFKVCRDKRKEWGIE